MFNDFWPKSPLQGGLSLNPEYRNNADTVGLFHTFDGGMRDISRYQRRIRKVDAGGDLIETVGELGRTTLFTLGATQDRYTFGQIPITDPVAFAGSDKINISIWIDFNDSLSGSYGRIIDKSDGGSGSNGWYLSAQTTLPNPSLEFSINSDFDVAPSGFLLTGLHHYLVNYDGAFVRWYRDGVNYDANAMTGTISSAATDMAIGQWNHSSIDRHFSGHIYSIEVNRADWNRDRADVEAHALWDPVTRWDMFAQDYPKPYIFFTTPSADVDVTTQTKAATITPFDVTVDAGAGVSVTTQTKAANIVPFDATVTATAGAAFGVADFEGNNLNESSSSITSPSSSTPTITMVPYLTNSSKFWGVCGAVQGVNGKTPLFEIDMANQWGSFGSMQFQWTATPYDIDSWQFFDNYTDLGGTNRRHSNNAAFTDDIIYFSNVRFVTHNVINTWLDTYEKNPYMQKPQSVQSFSGTSQWAYSAISAITDQNSLTIPAQEQLACRITDTTRFPLDGGGKRKIIFHSGVHASEDIGTEGLMRVIDALMNAAPAGSTLQVKAHDLLRDCDFYVYPTINPGRYRHHTYGLDDNVSSPYQPNAHWDDTRPYSRDWHEAVAVAIDTDLPTGTEHMLLDFHAQTNDSRTVEFWYSTGITLSDAQNFLDAVNDYEVSSGILADTNAGAIRDEAILLWGTKHSYAVEFPYSKNLTQAQVTAGAEAVLHAIHDRFSADMSQSAVTTRVAVTVPGGGSLSGLRWALCYGDSLEDMGPCFATGTAESTTAGGLLEILTTGQLEVGEKALLFFYNYAGDTDTDNYNATFGVVAAIAGGLTT